MPRLKALILGLPATLGFLCGVPAYGHGCGHYGGCATSNYRDHGRYGCGSWSNPPARSGWNAARMSPANAQTHEGKVVEVIYLPGATPDTAMVEFRLLSGDSTISVRLGPACFLKQSQLNLKEGDAITVSGYQVSTGDGDLLVATEVSKQGKTVRFRDRRGRPGW